jgi:hypothetical protein
MDPIVNITLTSGQTYAWQNAKLWQDANRRAAIFAQFWSKVQRADAKACWLYSDGPTFSVEGRPVPIAEFVYFAARSVSARGVIRQRCGESLCANPAHIERLCRICLRALSRRQTVTCSHHCAGILTLPRDQRGEKNGNFKGWRSKHPVLYTSEFKRLNPEKARAHRLLAYAIRKGRIVRPSACGACLKPCRPDAHHEDYSQPLVVLWRCRKCHAAADKALAARRAEAEQARRTA